MIEMTYSEMGDLKRLLERCRDEFTEENRTAQAGNPDSAYSKTVEMIRLVSLWLNTETFCDQ